MKTTHPHPTAKITDTYNTRNGTHAGIDLSAGKGTPIVAFAGGVVHTVMQGCVEGNTQCNGGAGNFVVIDHKNGYFTRYLHLDTINVKKGQTVKVGQKIGTEGNTGYSTGAHLHFEVRTDAGFGMQGSKDPAPYLNGKLAFPDAPNGTATKVGISLGVVLLLIVAYLWTFKRNETKEILGYTLKFLKLKK